MFRDGAIIKRDANLAPLAFYSKVRVILGGKALTTIVVRLTFFTVGLTMSSRVPTKKSRVDRYRRIFKPY
jgi:hypothetical protein